MPFIKKPTSLKARRKLSFVGFIVIKTLTLANEA